MRRSNCSAPIPPGLPRGHHFFCCCPGVLITVIFTCPALYNHPNYPFFECPALFYDTHFFSGLGAARGGGAEQFDRRITNTNESHNKIEEMFFDYLVSNTCNERERYIKAKLSGDAQFENVTSMHYRCTTLIMRLHKSKDLLCCDL